MEINMLPKTKEPPMEESVERLEPRVARLESDVAHILSSSEDIKIELRELRKSTDAKFDVVHGKLDAFRAEFTGKTDGVHKDLTGKIDGVEKKLSDKIDGVHKELNDKIDGVHKELVSVCPWPMDGWLARGR
jgi:hypothetical protein